MPEAIAPTAPPVPVVAKPVAPVNGKPAAAPPVEEFWEYTGEGGETRKLSKTEAQKRLSKAEYADKLIKQGAEAMKASKALQAKMEADAEADRKLKKENLREWLKKNEVDEDAHAREVLERKLKEQGMSQAERDAEQYKAKLAEHEKRDAERTKADEAAQVQKQAEHLQTLMMSELQKACTAVGWGETVDAEKFAIIQGLVQESFDAGLPVDAQWASRIVDTAKDRLDASHQRLEKAVLGGLKGQALVDRLGPAIVKEVLAHEVERIRGKRNTPTKATVEPVVSKMDEPYLNETQFKEQLRKLGAK